MSCLNTIATEQLNALVQTVVDRTILPSVVNTQILSPLKNPDPAVKIAFPGVNVNDREQANVRPPNPSLCVGNGFIIETTDLVSWHHPHLMAYTTIASLALLSIAFQPLAYPLLKLCDRGRRHCLHSRTVWPHHSRGVLCWLSTGVQSLQHQRGDTCRASEPGGFLWAQRHGQLLRCSL